MTAFLRILLMLIALFLSTSLNVGPGMAQSLIGLGGGKAPATDPTGDLAQAIRDATQSGASVIVIDSAGTVTTAGVPDAADTAVPPDTMQGASALMRAQARVQDFRQTLRNRLDSLPTSLAEVAYILRATSPDGRIMTYVRVLLWSLGLFLVGYIAMREIYAKRLVRRFVMSRVSESPSGYLEKMPFLVFRFVMGGLGTVFAMIVAYAIGAAIFGEQDDLSIQFTITAIYSAFFITRVISDLWRMILSPFLSQYRIPCFSDRDAKRLYRWIWLLTTFDVIAIIFSTWIKDFGLNYNVYAILYGSLTLIGAVLNIALVLFNAQAISNALRNGRPPMEVAWIVRVLSVAWAPVLIGYIVFAWLEMAFNLVLENPTSIPLVAGLYGVLVSIIVVYGGISYVIERYFDRSRELARMNRELNYADAAEEETTHRPDQPGRPRPTIATYEELARRVAGILAFVAGSYALLRIWDPANTVLRDSLVDRGLDVVTIIFIGYVLFHFFRIWIDSKIAEEDPAGPETELGDEGGATGASRLATLLPLFRGAILATVVIAIALIALLELGINVSPLFAGAGVVGLAVGFGAQTLVRDIFSGAFFLIDDAFRKGEYIDIGDVKGTVEKISVRSFQLRHHLGALNTIPFGEIKVLTNYSRDWVIMKLPLRVTYDTDVEKVRKLIKTLGQDLLADPVIGENFIQPLKSQGVIEMQDSAMIIRVKFMTKPGDQWLVRKKVYEEIRQLFEREGIRFAHREVTVRLADDKTADLTPQQKDAILGAAQTAIDQDMAELDGDRSDDR